MGLAGELVGDFLGDEIVESSVTGDGLSAGGDEEVVFDAGVTKKDVGRDGIGSDAAEAVILVEEETLAPPRVAEEDTVTVVGGVERGTLQFS